MSEAAGLGQVLIAGNPNCGKSTLFNAISGGAAQVGNYPGVTVDRTTAPLQLDSGRVELVDILGCTASRRARPRSSWP